MAQQPNTLPPVLQGIMNMPSPTQYTPPGSGLAGAMTSGGGLPSYEMGGQIGPGGQPVGGIQPPSPEAMGAPKQPMNADMMEMQIQEFMNSRPQELAQIKQAVMGLVQSGELTAQELNKLSQLAMAALRNPSMYPQIRQFAIQQGLATEQDIPAEYDDGLVFGIIVAARAAQGSMGGQDAMQGNVPAAQPPMPSMALGGQVPDSKSPTGEVVIKAHEKEMVMPRWLVEEKGTAFFKSMINKGPMDDKA